MLIQPSLSSAAMAHEAKSAAAIRAIESVFIACVIVAECYAAGGDGPSYAWRARALRPPSCSTACRTSDAVDDADMGAPKEITTGCLRQRGRFQRNRPPSKLNTLSHSPPRRT